MTQGIKVHNLTQRDQQIWISGDLIYAVGPYAMSLETPEVSGIVTEFYNGITIWQRQADGSLKIKTDAFNKSTTPGNPMSYGDLADNIVELQCCNENSDTLPDGHPLYQDIRDLEQEFHQLFCTGRRMKSLDYYTDDLLLCCTGYELVRGKPALRNLLIKSEGARSTGPPRCQNHRSTRQRTHDLRSQSLQLDMENKVSGQNFTIPGKGIHIWQKQADGSWKILYDLNSPDLKL